LTSPVIRPELTLLGVENRVSEDGDSAWFTALVNRNATDD